MAKVSFTVSDFSGGVNTYKGDSIIEDIELAQSKGFRIEPGIISVIGSMDGSYNLGAHTADAAAHNIESGYGIMTFSHDYDFHGNLSPTNYTVSQFHQRMYLYHNSLNDTDDDRWASTWDAVTQNIPHLGAIGSDEAVGDSTPYGFKVCLWMGENAFRVSPGNFKRLNSGGDLQNHADGSFAYDNTYGGTEAVVCAEGDDESGTGFHKDVKQGDLAVIGGQEMIALLVAQTSTTMARNMTGLFPASVDATDSDNTQVDLVLDTRWCGPCVRTNFPQAGTRGTFIEWHSTYAHPRPPVTFHTSLNGGAINQRHIPFLAQLVAHNEAITVDGTLSPCVSIGYRNDEDGPDDGTTWDGETIHLYLTALYDDIRQESHPHRMTPDAGFTVPAEKEFGVCVAVSYADGAASPSNTYLINKRCTGARLYYEDVTNEEGVLYQMVEIDFSEGCKKPEGNNFTPWVQKVANECVISHSAGDAYGTRDTDGGGAFIFLDPPKGFTYDMNTGFPMFVDTYARYKTAAIVNGRLFVGNVYQSGATDGDRMIGSPFHKYDILPGIDPYVTRVSAGDGDEIVKLEGYGDKILQFKKRTLYIVNVGGEIGDEYLESQHRNMGVENPSQTCETEYGIAWVNSSGVYLYDGADIMDLTTEKLQTVNTTNRPRALNVVESNIPIIGYHPKNKWLVVMPQSVVVRLIGTTFTASASAGTIADSASGFLDEGFQADTYITCSGSSESGNNATHYVSSVTASTLTITGTSLTDDSAGDTWTITNHASAEAWVHDFKNKTWTYSANFSNRNDLKSNMAWSSDNELIFKGDGETYGADAGAAPDWFKYQDRVDSSSDVGVGDLLLLTKRFDLGEPGTKKKLQGIYITYSADADTKIEADVIYTHPTGESTDDLAEADSGSTYYTEASGFLSTSGSVRTVQLVPTTPVTNAYTFQLKLHNPDLAYPYGANFKLMSMQFIYRPLGIR